MRKILFFITLFLSTACYAGTITQTRQFSISSEIQDMSWDQFNPSLGKLLSVEYRLHAMLSGSLFIKNLSEVQFATLENSKNIFENVFIGDGAPELFTGSSMIPIETVPTAASMRIAPGSTQMFIVPSNPAPELYVPLTDLTVWSSYFTGYGTISSTVAQYPEVIVTGSEFYADTSPIIAIGEAQLTFNYDNSPQTVPEPQTILISSLGFLGSFVYRKFKRKSNKNKV